MIMVELLSKSASMAFNFNRDAYIVVLVVSTSRKSDFFPWKLISFI